MVYVLVYVDDISLITKIIQGLGFGFALKDLRPLHYFLGIEVVKEGTDDRVQALWFPFISETCSWNT